MDIRTLIYSFVFLVCGGLNNFMYDECTQNSRITNPKNRLTGFLLWKIFHHKFCL